MKNVIATVTLVTAITTMNNTDLKIKELHDYARKNNIPIIMDDGLSFLLTKVRELKPVNILEIGTAVGYSASLMHLVSNAFVVTIEKNEKMVNEAKKTFNELKINDNIRIIHKDGALAYEDVSDKFYDLIFIDAAKAQYQVYFELYANLLTENGIIICDNLDFHGLVDELPLTASRSLKGLIRKIKRFITFLESNTEFETEFYHIGDGMSISKRK